jgi:Na+/proline symporter
VGAVSRIDWFVLAAWLISIVAYGLWRGRQSKTVSQYLLAGKTMPWYAMGLSIMATQASAITFISTTGQAYVDGMRFVQFYFGLPLAMVILSATAVPIFHRARVYTAYEYLEQRFDSRTRALVTSIFLIQRGLAAGISLYAPAVALSVVLGLPDRITTVLMGVLVILYTSLGGIQAVTWADVQQMTVILAALVLALIVAIHLLPPDVSFKGALSIAGAAGRLNPVVWKFDWNDRYNVWSGLIGGMFLALAYFGTDQSQVQRYLTGKSVGQSRLSLLFNAMAKIPMQFFILFIGAMVFVLFTFARPPITFHPVAYQRMQSSPEYPPLQSRYNQTWQRRSEAAHAIAVDPQSATAKTSFQAAQKDFDLVRADARKLAAKVQGESVFNDTNYIFLTFVKTYMPIGVVGLVIGVIFSAAMSSISGEINSLATVSIIDVYRRHVRPHGSDRHYLWASRLATAFWGVYAVVFASNAGSGFGALIETVNVVGSLFYGGMLGVFVLAFFFKRVGGRGAFWGVLAGEAVIFAAWEFTKIAFLWYNVIGCFVVIMAGVTISALTGEKVRHAATE